jgi:hypothetical protein
VIERWLARGRSVEGGRRREALDLGGGGVDRAETVWGASDGLQRSEAAVQAQGDTGDGLGREKTVCGAGVGRE